MTLVDSSVWIDHLRRHNVRLVALLERGEVACHPFVIGEIALGSLKHRQQVLEALGELPMSRVAPHADVLTFVDRHSLAGQGVGWVDAHLLTAAVIDQRPLWTLDRRLAAVAGDLNALWQGR